MTFWSFLTTWFLSALLLGACDQDDDTIVDNQHLEDALIDTLVIADGVPFVRMPEVYFQNLPDWPHAYQCVEIDGLRQAYAETEPANGEVVQLLDSRPSWSYLYRGMMPVLSVEMQGIVPIEPPKGLEDLLFPAFLAQQLPFYDGCALITDAYFRQKFYKRIFY